MKDPMDALQGFYESCNEALPKGGLPDPRSLLGLRLRAVRRVAIQGLGPLAIGAGFALILLTLGSRFEPSRSERMLEPILKKRLKDAGVSLQEFQGSSPSPKSSLEVSSWGA